MHEEEHCPSGHSSKGKLSILATSSDAPVTSCDALVTSSFLLLLVMPLLLVAMPLWLVASCYYAHANYHWVFWDHNQDLPMWEIAHRSVVRQLLDSTPLKVGSTCFRVFRVNMVAGYIMKAHAHDNAKRFACCLQGCISSNFELHLFNTRPAETSSIYIMDWNHESESSLMLQQSW